MEGVIVSAKKDGSTITVSVLSNAGAYYSFPTDRLCPAVQPAIRAPATISKVRRRRR
jgi:hypothetical protein